MSQKPAKRKSVTSASTADRHELYEIAVQAVDAEIDMVDDTFTSIRGRKASLFREDFCGTANSSCEWVRRRSTNFSIGLDLSQEVLDWGMSNNISGLDPDQQQRIELINQDVNHYSGPPVEIIVAMNFSYQLFKTRDELRCYFENARDGLTEEGVFFIDAYGGYDSWREIKEKTKFKDFTYYWHQKKYNPITANMLCHIHFKFKDGSKIKKAFTYDWRMWTLPELREILLEAGFRKVTVYWEGTDEETGEWDGTYTATEQGDDDPAWIVYLSAEK
jgi:SAM-dependent methyltransferase